MPGYFDSSVLLSLLLGDPSSREARELWLKEEERVSSVLFEVECLNVLRRIAKQEFDPKWLAAKEKILSGFLEEISLQNIDGQILEIIRREMRLSDCRSLDAIHIATALFFKSASPQPLAFHTFDNRMQKLAAELGIPTK